MSADIDQDRSTRVWPPTPGRARQSGVQSLDRAVAILGAFTQERPELAMSEVSRMTGLSTSTTHRLLNALQTHDLVRQLADRRYALGPYVSRLAHVGGARINLREAAAPVMHRLRDESGETVGLHALRGNCRVVVDQVESREALRRTYTNLGEGIPLNQGAPGKVLMAFLPHDAREAILSQRLQPLTSHTVVDPDRLRHEVECIRRQGYGFAFEERARGIHSIAVPARDHTGVVMAALSVTGPASRLTRARMQELVPLALEGGRELSARLDIGDASWASADHSSTAT